MGAKLFYLIGASGAGKDSVLEAARQTLKKRCNTVIIQRYITRPPGDGELHIPMSFKLFAQQLSAGEFCLHWEANGNCYGIGLELDNLLARGVNVLVNGSRAYLAQAQKRYPDLVPVLVQVDESHLRERLQQRARESAEQIEQRLVRHRELVDTLPADIQIVDNSGELAHSCEQLCAIVGRVES
ncbi:MAG: phosphonate metabolism protein/1,5-bisphosphokinase (PRPP-forming) PhnN [Pseudomonadales bacterium]